MSHTASEKPFGPFHMNRFGERYLPSVNQEAFSRVGSAILFGQQFAQIVDQKDSLYLFVGTDSGLLVNWIIKRKRPEGTRFVFLEFPELIERLQEEQILPVELPAGIFVLPPDQWVGEAEKLSLKDYFYLDQVFHLKSLAVMDGNHDGYVSMYNDTETALGQLRIQVGQEIGSRIFMIKCLENLAENRTPALKLRDYFKGRTAVLLAGGPSLPDSFPWIRQHREDVAILAVGRVADRLRQEGLVPDCLFAIDPHDVIFHQSKGMLAFWEQTLLVSMYHLNPALTGQWRGRSVYMGTLFPWDSELNGENVVYPGITVGHQALGMALDMGFSQVVMAGFDLCFSREGFTHVTGSVEQEIGPYVLRSDLLVETNGGWMAETQHDFLNAIPSLAALAKMGQNRGCRLINPAAGAAKIPHVDHAPWDEITLEPVESSAWELIVGALSQESSATRMAHYQAVDNELNTIRRQVAKVKALAVDGLAANDGLFGRRGKPANFKYKKEMDAIEQRLDETYREVSRLVKRWGLGAMLKLSRPDKEREWSDLEIEEAGRRYYEIYRDNALELTKLLNDVRQRIASRMEEEKSKPNYKTLIEQWKKDKQPARYHLFLARTGQTMADLPEHVATAFQELEVAFQEVMAETDHDYKKYVLSFQSSPMDIRAKASALFRNKEKVRLQQFGMGLEQSSLAEKDQYLHLIRGYLAEMEQQMGAAMRHYRQVTHELLQTESLRRIFTLALQDHDLLTALAVSKRLSHYSFSHIPYYAELLRMTGDGEAAVGVFEGYLKIVQKDFVTMVKLGRLYMELGRPEDARETFGRILTEDPDNQAVQSFLEDLETMQHGDAQ